MGTTVSVGSVIGFEYPAANYHCVRMRWEPRKLFVRRVRDTAASPLDPATIQIDPLLRRGRFLITGQDLDKQMERSFYLDAMRRRPIVLRFKRCKVIVVSVPKNWVPTKWSDIPPVFDEVEVMVDSVPRARAEGLVFGFNTASMLKGGEVWAIAEPVFGSTAGRTS